MAIILQNRACPQDETTSCTYNRTLIPQTEETLVSAVTNANLAVFFDILENVKCFKIVKLKFLYYFIGLSRSTCVTRK